MPHSLPWSTYDACWLNKNIYVFVFHRSQIKAKSKLNHSSNHRFGFNTGCWGSEKSVRDRGVDCACEAEKVEAAYESLRQRTTDVYVQRARQLYTIAPQRTSLFLWLLDDVSVVALADPSYHGYENIVRVMCEIDPARSAIFVTALCSVVGLQVYTILVFNWLCRPTQPSHPLWVSPKNPICSLSDIFPKPLGIFNQFFTHLLYVPFYTWLQILIQLSPTLTKLCHTKRDHPTNFYISLEV